MTDADLTLRDEVAEVLSAHGGYVPAPRVGDGWRCWCGADLRDWWPEGGVTPRDTALDYALRAHRTDALLPLLARVREEGEARVRERVAAVWPDPFGEFTATEAAAAKLMKDAIRAALTPPCPTCDGVGERYTDHPTGDPALQQRETCRDCDGEGTA